MSVKKKPTRKKKEAPTVEPTISAEEFFSSVEPKPEYIKHVVECRCHLPIFENRNPIPNHKFVVFSELDEHANVKQHYAQCNNCDIVHRVTDVGESTTLKKESMKTMETMKDIASQLPEWLTALLEEYECELHVWQEAKFILQHELWGRFIILSKETEDGKVFAKLCQIIGAQLHKIENIEDDEMF